MTDLFSSPQFAEFLSDVENASKKCPSIPKIGEIVAVEASSTKFRAIRVPQTSNETNCKNMLRFFFIDTGEEDNFEESHSFYELPDYIKKAQPLAIYCKLKSVCIEVFY